MSLDHQLIATYGDLVAERLRNIQSIAIAAALCAGDEEVAIAGKSGTPARQFDLAAHTILTTLCQETVVPGVEVHVLTEETPHLERETARLEELVAAKPDQARLVYLFDPIDGSMQYLKAGVGWCTAGLATAWFPDIRQWSLVWAGVMLPGGRDAIWLPAGNSRPQPAQTKETAVDTVAVNDFRLHELGSAILEAVRGLTWIEYRLSSGGNPIAVSIARRSEAVMVQPMASMPHDTIGTLILSSLDNEVYDLTDPSGSPVPTSDVLEWFSDPTTCHDKTRVPPHVVGPPGAAFEVWQVAHPSVIEDRGRQS